MKKEGPLALFLIGLASLSGWLMQKPSLVGRIGIALLYKEYRFLRTWWKTAALEILVFFLLLAMLYGVYRRARMRTLRFSALLVLIAGLVGFALTWQDFHQTTTHRMLKERFHMGAYLFWIGWLTIPIFFLFRKPRESHAPERRHPAV